MSTEDKVIYIIDMNDCIFENGVLVRLKRKYGKNKRIVQKVTVSENECNNLENAKWEHQLGKIKLTS